MLFFNETVELRWDPNQGRESQKSDTLTSTALQRVLSLILYCVPGKQRQYFRGYNDIAASRDKWAEEIIQQFRNDFVLLKKAATAANSPGKEGGE